VPGIESLTVQSLDCSQGCKVGAKVEEAGILSQQPGFDSHPGKTTKKDQKPPRVP